MPHGADGASGTRSSAGCSRSAAPPPVPWAQRPSWLAHALDPAVYFVTVKSLVEPLPAFLKFFLFFIFYFWLRWVLVAVRGLLIAVASLVAEHGL